MCRLVEAPHNFPAVSENRRLRDCGAKARTHCRYMRVPKNSSRLLMSNFSLLRLSLRKIRSERLG